MDIDEYYNDLDTAKKLQYKKFFYLIFISDFSVADEC